MGCGCGGTSGGATGATAAPGVSVLQPFAPIPGALRSEPVAPEKTTQTVQTGILFGLSLEQLIIIGLLLVLVVRK